MKQIAILGAGITGLSLAWYLQKKSGKGLQITLIEQSDRVGGLISTLHHPEGFLFEQGPHTLRTKGSGADLLELVEDLGLQKEVIFSNESAKVRYLLQNQKLIPLPTSLFSFLSSPLTRPHLSSFFKELWRPKTAQKDLSIYDFATYRWNAKISETFFDPLTTGIYAGDIHTLSLPACFPNLWKWEQQYGSVLKGALFAKREKQKNPSLFIKKAKRHSLFSFKNGMETLPKALAEGLSIIYKKVTAIHHNQITLENGQTLHPDLIFSTLPAHVLAKLLKTELTIPTKSLTMVHVGWKKEVLKQKGFGYLIPKTENASILGMLFDSCIFPQQNQDSHETRLTIMLEYDVNPIPKALESLSKHLQIHQQPDLINVTHVEKAIPQYRVGHFEKMKAFRTTLGKSLFALGSSFEGVSIADCVKQSKSLASLIAKNL